MEMMVLIDGMVMMDGRVVEMIIVVLIDEMVVGDGGV